MAGMLENLENNEAILLMYLADELPAEDRVEVESMLATDASLRGELERLRALQAETFAMLREGEGRRGAAHAEAQVRAVMRAMRKEQLEPRREAVVEESGMVIRRWPGWAYPVAAAAAVVFLLIGLWGLNVFDFPGGTRTVAGGGGPSIEENGPAPEHVAQELERSLAGGMDEAEVRFRALQGDEEAWAGPIL